MLQATAMQRMPLTEKGCPQLVVLRTFLCLGDIVGKRKCLLCGISLTSSYLTLQTEAVCALIQLQQTASHMTESLLKQQIPLYCDITPYK